MRGGDTPEVLALLRGASMAAATGDYAAAVLDRSVGRGPSPVWRR
ncbi:hypothetical protein [Virgisporangium ochraceum]|nr:hypothetical protein [Virgisporangium ochraceum]